MACRNIVTRITKECSRRRKTLLIFVTCLMFVSSLVLIELRLRKARYRDTAPAIQILTQHLCMSTTTAPRTGKHHVELPRPCPNPPTNLDELIFVDLTNTTFDKLVAEFPDVRVGGRWALKHCKSASKVAILVPFRDREEHLKIFLRHMHRFLQKQLLDYIIYVIEQTNGTKFNRGFLFNVGVFEALQEQRFECFVFHDVDLLPENLTNLYHCPNTTAHLATALSKWNYAIVHEDPFGGVTMMSCQDYININGFSNRFHGWGGEDDDNRLRIIEAKLGIYEVPLEIGRYTALSHKKAEPNVRRNEILDKTWRDPNVEKIREGLDTIDYQLLEMQRKPLYTWILVKPNYED